MKNPLMVYFFFQCIKFPHGNNIFLRHESQCTVLTQKFKFHFYGFKLQSVNSLLHGSVATRLQLTLHDAKTIMIMRISQTEQKPEFLRQ